MATEKSRTTRRKFLLAAGATGAATIAMPQVSRAQTTTLKMQTSWPATDIFTEMAQQYITRVNEMAGGRLKIDPRMPDGSSTSGPCRSGSSSCSAAPS